MDGLGNPHAISLCTRIIKNRRLPPAVFILCSGNGGSLGGLGFGGYDADLLDVVVGDAGDGDVEGLEVEAGAGLGQAAELLHDPAADGGHIRVAFQAEMLRKVVKAHLGVDQVGIGGQLGDGRLLLVVLVPDLADQLLQNVLHRDDAAGAAVFVDHDGHVSWPAGAF